MNIRYVLLLLQVSANDAETVRQKPILANPEILFFGFRPPGGDLSDFKENK